MEGTLPCMAEAGEPLLQQALQAIRGHQKAVSEGRPLEEIERPRLEADHLYQAVIDHQLHKASARPRNSKPTLFQPYDPEALEDECGKYLPQPVA